MSSAMTSKQQLVKIIIADPLHGCGPLPSLAEMEDKNELLTPVYYLVRGRDGDCSYSLKAYQARKALAQGIIITHSPDNGINNLRASHVRQNFQILLMPET